ncbi:MAG TPA: O-antigen ligase family protein [Thermoguttaceae bacterium]|nr:O-antigen ligase family protein [Thermoguttaceae bacterium]
MGSDPRHGRRSGRRRSSRTSAGGSRPQFNRLASLLLKAVDGGLAAAIFVVPFALGGRIAIGQFAMVALAVWVALCWSIRQSLSARAVWIRSSTEPLLLAAVALIGLQLIALPPSWLSWISPQHYETLPLWNPAGDASGTLGVWSTISLTPTATCDALVMVLAFIMLFLTTIQRVRQVEDVERLLRWIAIATLSMAIFGIVQYVTSNGKYFWFYEHERYAISKHVLGSFTNHNHFAQFLALGIGPLVWWGWSTARHRSKTGSGRQRSSYHAARGDSNQFVAGMRMLGLAICVFAILMSLSRGGLLAAGLAGMACLLVLKRASLIDRKMLIGIGGSGLLVVVGLSIFGYDAFADRMDSFQSLEELDRGGRMQLWEAALAGIADYPVTGTGLGSHREVCPTYHRAKDYYLIEYTHAENGYLQIALETGLPGLLLAIVGVGFLIYWSLQLLRTATSTRILLCLAAIIPAFIGSCAHSAVDFVWYVPGCMVTLIVLAACACRLWQLTGQGTDKRGSDKARPEVLLSRPAWIVGSCCLTLVGFFMLENRMVAVRAEPAWNRYVALDDSTPDGFDNRIPPQTLRSMVKELSTVVALQPGNARAHTRLAAVHLQIFNEPEDANVSPIDVRQVREAVLASEFESSVAMHEWLSVAFGDRTKHLDTAYRHVREALRLCPLQGEAYLDLANLSFLAGPNFPPKAAIIQQALKVRPFDGTTLFVAGQEAMIAGDQDSAIEYWKASFDLGPHHQERLLSLLTPQVPAEFILETFHPSVDALGLTAGHFQKAGREEEAQLVLAKYAEAAARQAAAEQGEIAAKYWLGAAYAYKRLGNPSEACKCCRLTLNADPTSVEAHLHLAALLLDLEEFAESEKHARWCLQSDPRNRHYQKLLRKTVEGRLRSRTTAAQRDLQPVVR